MFQIDKDRRLIFRHTGPDDDGARTTCARIVEYSVERPADPPGHWQHWVPKGDGWQCVVAEGCARCSPTDQFSREAGRRIALDRMEVIGPVQEPALVCLIKDTKRRYFDLQRRKRLYRRAMIACRLAGIEVAPAR